MVEGLDADSVARESFRVFNAADLLGAYQSNLQLRVAKMLMEIGSW